MCQVRQRSSGGDRGADSEANNDVRQLRDGRVRQPLLDVVLRQSSDRAKDDGEASNDCQRHRETQVPRGVGAVEVHNYAADAEYARLHDRDRVQQRAHGRGRHHSGGQPAVGREQRRFHAKAGHEQRKDDRELRTVRREQISRDAASSGELSPTAERVEPDDAQRQQCAAGQRVLQVRPAAGLRLGVAVVDHERVGRQRQRLVEDKQRQQVRGERDADCRSDTDGEEPEEASFVGSVGQVAVGVDGSREPEHGRHDRKDGAHAVDGQTELRAQQRNADRNAVTSTSRCHADRDR